MKSLFSLLAVGILATSITTPLIGQTSINQKINDFASEVESHSFWFPDRKFEFVNDYGAIDVRHWSRTITYNIGKNDISKMKNFSAIDPGKESYTKTSWGNDAYWGKPFSDIKSLSLDSFIVRNKKIINIDDVINNAKVELLKTSDEQGLATMQTKHYFGLSYYFENNDNFVQFFAYQYVSVNMSFSGGRLWTNLGQGFNLN